MTKTTQKIISLVTLACFVMTQSISANPGAGIQIAPKFETPSFLQIDIPSELATLDGLYEAPPRPDPRLILHIQNAHANYDAQMKIKQLIGYLHKTYDFKTIFVEGAVEELDPTALQMFPDAERNQKLADLMAREGELNGVELFLLSQDGATHNAQRTTQDGKTESLSVERSTLSAPRAYGIEKADLYRENYEALKKVFGAEVPVAKYLNGFEARLDTLASKVFPPDLRRNLAEWKKFEKGHREFMPFIHSLAVEAKQVLKIDLESVLAQVEWPQITRLMVLQTLEKDLNTDKALAEKDALLAFLQGKQVSPQLFAAIKDFQGQRVSVLRSQSDATPAGLQPRDLMEKLVMEAGPQGFKFSDYPQFSTYAGYLILKNELDPKGLFEEIKAVFTRILDTQAVSPRQKELVQLFRDEELIRKLLNLELPRKEWQEVEQKRGLVKTPATLNEAKDLGGDSSAAGFRMTENADSLSMDAMVARLKVIGTALSKEYGLPLSNFETKKVNDKFRSEVTGAQAAAYSFYEAAHKRENVFYEKINDVMTKGAVSKAILVTGGFHTDGITDLLREHQTSYGILTPRLTEKSNDKMYRQNMLQTQSSLFDLATLELPSVLQRSGVLSDQGVDIEALERHLESWFLKLLGGDPKNLEATIKFYNDFVAKEFEHPLNVEPEGENGYVMTSDAFTKNGKFYAVHFTPIGDGSKYSVTVSLARSEGRQKPRSKVRPTEEPIATTEPVSTKDLASGQKGEKLTKGGLIFEWSAAGNQAGFQDGHQLFEQRLFPFLHEHESELNHYLADVGIPVNEVIHISVHAGVLSGSGRHVHRMTFQAGGVSRDLAIKFSDERHLNLQSAKRDKALNLKIVSNPRVARKVAREISVDSQVHFVDTDLVYMQLSEWESGVTLESFIKSNKDPGIRKRIFEQLLSDAHLLWSQVQFEFQSGFPVGVVYDYGIDDVLLRNPEEVAKGATPDLVFIDPVKAFDLPTDSNEVLISAFTTVLGQLQLVRRFFKDAAELLGFLGGVLGESSKPVFQHLRGMDATDKIKRDFVRNVVRFLEAEPADFDLAIENYLNGRAETRTLPVKGRIPIDAAIEGENNAAMRAILAKDGLIGRNSGEFSGIYNEVETVFRDILGSQKVGLVPDQFELHLMDKNEPDAFVYPGDHRVYISLGFLKLIEAYVAQLPPDQKLAGSRAMIAYILSHETGHIKQGWADYEEEQRLGVNPPLNSILKRRAVRFTDEEDADNNALDFMESAGYSMQGAIMAMRCIREYMKANNLKDSWLGEHNTVERRLKNMENQKKRYWRHFNDTRGDISTLATKELGGQSRRRTRESGLKEEAVSKRITGSFVNYGDKASLKMILDLMSSAETMEELQTLYALAYILKRKNGVDDSEAVYKSRASTLCSKLSPDEVSAYEVQRKFVLEDAVDKFLSSNSSAEEFASRITEFLTKSGSAVNGESLLGLLEAQPPDILNFESQSVPSLSRAARQKTAQDHGREDMEKSFLELKSVIFDSHIRFIESVVREYLARNQDSLTPEQLMDLYRRIDQRKRELEVRAQYEAKPLGGELLFRDILRLVESAMVKKLSAGATLNDADRKQFLRLLTDHPIDSVEDLLALLATGLLSAEEQRNLPIHATCFNGGANPVIENREFVLRWLKAINAPTAVEAVQLALEMFKGKYGDYISTIMEYYHLGPEGEIDLLRYALTTHAADLNERWKLEDEQDPDRNYDVRAFDRGLYARSLQQEDLLLMNSRLYEMILGENGLSEELLSDRIDSALAAAGVENAGELALPIRKIIFFYEMGGVFGANDYEGIIEYFKKIKLIDDGDPAASGSFKKTDPVHNVPFSLVERTALYNYLLSQRDVQTKRGTFSRMIRNLPGDWKPSAIGRIRTWNGFMVRIALALRLGKYRDNGIFDTHGRSRRIGEVPYRVDRLFFSDTPDVEISDQAYLGPFSTHDWQNRWLLYLPSDLIRNVSPGTVQNLLPSQIFNRLLDYGLPISAAGRTFEEVVAELNAVLPDGMMKNMALYLVFVEMVLRKNGVVVDDTMADYFDIAGVRQKIGALPAGQQQAILRSAALIMPSLQLDVAMEEANERIRISKSENCAININNAGQFAPSSVTERYTPAEFTNTGGHATQIVYAVPMLLRDILASHLSAEVPETEVKDIVEVMQSRRDLVRSFFAENSEPKDYFMEQLFRGIRDAMRANKLTREQQDSLITHMRAMLDNDFKSSSVRERSALLALEVDREMRPDLFSDFSEEVRIVVENYFKEFSYTRDDVLRSIQNERVVTPRMLEIVQSYLLQFRGNTRKEGVRDNLFGKEKILLQVVSELAPESKKDLILWLVGVTENKPAFLLRIEHDFEVNYDFLRELFRGGEEGHYKGIGTSLRQDMLDLLLYGKNGVLAETAKVTRRDMSTKHGLPYVREYPNHAAADLFDAIFNYAYPKGEAGTEKERRDLYKGIYDILIEAGDPYRKEQVLLSLCAGLSRIADPGLSREEREAEVVGLVFESFGITMVKLGQILSSSPLIDDKDITPEIRARLERLKDGANPMPIEDKFEMTDRVFGSFTDVFQELHNKKRNASVKAVDEALTQDGSREIVKIKRPDGEQRIEEEIAFMRRVAAMLGDKLKINVPKQMLDRVEDRIRKEMDFDLEGENQKRLAKAIRVVQAGAENAFRGYEFDVPIAHEIAQNSVMRERTAPGVPLTDDAGVAALGIDPVAVEHILGHLFFRMMFICGFYHADPHRGNIFVSRTAEGKIRISIIDLGAASTLSIDSRKSLWALMQALLIGQKLPVGKGIARKMAVKELRALLVGQASMNPDVEVKISNVLASGKSMIGKFLGVIAELERAGIPVKDDVMDVFNLLASCGQLFNFSGMTSLELLKMVRSIKSADWLSVEDLSGADAAKINIPNVRSETRTPTDVAQPARSSESRAEQRRNIWRRLRRSPLVRILVPPALAGVLCFSAMKSNRVYRWMVESDQLWSVRAIIERVVVTPLKGAGELNVAMEIEKGSTGLSLEDARFMAGINETIRQLMEKGIPYHEALPILKAEASKYPHYVSEEKRFRELKRERGMDIPADFPLLMRYWAAMTDYLIKKYLEAAGIDGKDNAEASTILKRSTSILFQTDDLTTTFARVFIRHPNGFEFPGPEGFEVKIQSQTDGMTFDSWASVFWHEYTHLLSDLQIGASSTEGPFRDRRFLGAALFKTLATGTPTGKVAGQSVVKTPKELHASWRPFLYGTGGGESWTGDLDLIDGTFNANFNRERGAHYSTYSEGEDFGKWLLERYATSYPADFVARLYMESHESLDLGQMILAGDILERILPPIKKFSELGADRNPSRKEVAKMEQWALAQARLAGPLYEKPLGEIGELAIKIAAKYSPKKSASVASSPETEGAETSATPAEAGLSRSGSRWVSPANLWKQFQRVLLPGLIMIQVVRYIASMRAREILKHPGFLYAVEYLVVYLSTFPYVAKLIASVLRQAPVETSPLGQVAIIAYLLLWDVLELPWQTPWFEQVIKGGVTKEERTLAGFALALKYAGAFFLLGGMTAVAIFFLFDAAKLIFKWDQPGRLTTARAKVNRFLKSAFFAGLLKIGELLVGRGPSLNPPNAAEVRPAEPGAGRSETRVRDALNLANSAKMDGDSIDRFLEYLARSVPVLRNEFPRSVGVVQKLSLRKHDAQVLHEFEQRKEFFPNNFSPRFYRLLIAIHDVGKPTAVEDDGDKSLQHKRSLQLIQDNKLYDLFEFTPEERKLANALIAFDPLGRMLERTYSARIRGDDAEIAQALEDAFVEVRTAAREAQLPIAQFFQILTEFYRVDAGSYAGLREHAFDEQMNFKSPDYEELKKLVTNGRRKGMPAEASSSFVAKPAPSKPARAPSTRSKGANRFSHGWSRAVMEKWKRAKASLKEKGFPISRDGETLNIAQIYLVHMTDANPEEDGFIHPRSFFSEEVLTPNGDFLQPHAWETLHFSLNSTVTSSLLPERSPFYRAKYVVLIPLAAVLDQLAVIDPMDTVIIGSLKLPPGSVILGNETFLPEAALPASSGIEVRRLSEDPTQTVSDAVAATLLDKGVMPMDFAPKIKAAGADAKDDGFETYKAPRGGWYDLDGEDLNNQRAFANFAREHHILYDSPAAMPLEKLEELVHRVFNYYLKGEIGALRALHDYYDPDLKNFHSLLEIKKHIERFMKLSADQYGAHPSEEVRKGLARASYVANQALALIRADEALFNDTNKRFNDDRGNSAHAEKVRKVMDAANPGQSREDMFPPIPQQKNPLGFDLMGNILHELRSAEADVRREGIRKLRFWVETQREGNPLRDERLTQFLKEGASDPEIFQAVVDLLMREDKTQGLPSRIALLLEVDKSCRASDGLMQQRGVLARSLVALNKASAGDGVTTGTLTQNEDMREYMEGWFPGYRGLSMSPQERFDFIMALVDYGILKSPDRIKSELALFFTGQHHENLMNQYAVRYRDSYMADNAGHPPLGFHLVDFLDELSLQPADRAQALSESFASHAGIDQPGPLVGTSEQPVVLPPVPAKKERPAVKMLERDIPMDEPVKILEELTRSKWDGTDIEALSEDALMEHMDGLRAMGLLSLNGGPQIDDGMLDQRSRLREELSGLLKYLDARAIAFMISSFKGTGRMYGNPRRSNVVMRVVDNELVLRLADNGDLPVARAAWEIMESFTPVGGGQLDGIPRRTPFVAGGQMLGSGPSRSTARLPQNSELKPINEKNWSLSADEFMDVVMRVHEEDNGEEFFGEIQGDDNASAALKDFVKRHYLFAARSGFFFNEPKDRYFHDFVAPGGRSESRSNNSTAATDRSEVRKALLRRAGLAGLSLAASISLHGQQLEPDYVPSVTKHEKDGIHLTGYMGKAPVYMMQNHNSAYLAWAAAGIHEAVLYHWDSHFDLGDLENVKDPDKPDMSKPSFSIEGFIAPAVLQHMISEIYWILPEYPGAAPAVLKGGTYYVGLLTSKTDPSDKQVYMHPEEDPGKRYPGILEKYTLSHLRPIKVHIVYLKELPQADPGKPLILDFDMDGFSMKNKDGKDPFNAAGLKAEVERVFKAFAEKDVVPTLVDAALSPNFIGRGADVAKVMTETIKAETKKFVEKSGVTPEGAGHEAPVQPAEGKRQERRTLETTDQIRSETRTYPDLKMKDGAALVNVDGVPLLPSELEAGLKNGDISRVKTGYEFSDARLKRIWFHGVKKYDRDPLGDLAATGEMSRGMVTIAIEEALSWQEEGLLIFNFPDMETAKLYIKDFESVKIDPEKQTSERGFRRYGVASRDLIFEKEKCKAIPLEFLTPSSKWELIRLMSLRPGFDAEKMEKLAGFLKIPFDQVQSAFDESATFLGIPNEPDRSETRELLAGVVGQTSTMPVISPVSTRGDLRAGAKPVAEVRSSSVSDRSEVRLSTFTKTMISAMADRFLLDMAFRLRDVDPAKLNVATDLEEWNARDLNIGKAIDAVLHEKSSQWRDLSLSQKEALDFFVNHRDECIRIISNYIRSLKMGLSHVALLIRWVNQQKAGAKKDSTPIQSQSAAALAILTGERPSEAVVTNAWEDSVLHMSPGSVALYSPDMGAIRARLERPSVSELLERNAALPERENIDREVFWKIFATNLSRREADSSRATEGLLSVLRDIVGSNSGQEAEAALPGAALARLEGAVRSYEQALEDERSTQGSAGMVMKGLSENNAASVREVIRDIVKNGRWGSLVQEHSKKIFALLADAGISVDADEIIFVADDSELSHSLYSDATHEGSHIDLGGGKSVILVRTKFHQFEDLETVIHELTHKDYRSARTSEIPENQRSLSLVVEEARVSGEAIQKTAEIGEKIEKTDPLKSAEYAEWKAQDGTQTHPRERRFLSALTAHIPGGENAIERYLRSGNADALGLGKERLERLNGFINDFARRIYDPDSVYVVALTFAIEALEQPERFEMTLEAGQAVCEFLKAETGKEYANVGLGIASLAVSKMVKELTQNPSADAKALVAGSFRAAREESSVANAVDAMEAALDQARGAAVEAAVLPVMGQSPTAPAVRTEAKEGEMRSEARPTVKAIAAALKVTGFAEQYQKEPEARGTKTVDAGANILKALPPELRALLGKKKMSEVRAALSVDAKMPEAIVLVAFLVGGIMALSQDSPEEAARKLESLLAAAGGEEAPDIVSAFKRSNPKAFSHLAGQGAGRVFELVDALPTDEKELDAWVGTIVAIFMLNPNPEMRYKLPVVTDLGKQGPSPAQVRALKNRVIAAAEKRGMLRKDVEKRFSVFLTTTQKLNDKLNTDASGGSYVLLGARAIMRKLTDNLNTAKGVVVEEAYDATNADLRMASRLGAVGLSQALVPGKELSELTIMEMGFEPGKRITATDESLQSRLNQIGDAIHAFLQVLQAA